MNQQANVALQAGWCEQPPIILRSDNLMDYIVSIWRSTSVVA